MEVKLGMKKLTLTNWMQPDEASKSYHVLSEEGARPMNESDWANCFMNIELSQTVPEDVQRLFENARAALCYGWFYHSLFTFGMEQVCRVAETAVKVKCKEVGLYVYRDSFKIRIEKLVAGGFIPASEADMWHNTRLMRNDGSHPDGQMILPPGANANLVRYIAGQISALFP